MEDGKPLFCARDVAVALGYSNTSKAIGDHCSGVTKRYTPTTSGHQEISFIPESDVYRLVMRSKLPGAERFQDWVVEEVLPTIRKTGRFEIAPAAQAVKRGQELANQAEKWNTERRRINLPGNPSAEPWPDLRKMGTPIRVTPPDSACVEFLDADTTMLIAEQEDREMMEKSERAAAQSPNFASAYGRSGAESTPENVIERLRREEAHLGPVRQMCREDGRQRAIFGIEEIPAGPAAQPFVVPFDPDNVPDVWPPAVTSSAPGSTEKTMSSLEIAELTGKNHRDVMRDIRAVMEQAEIDERKFARIYRDARNREKPCYLLPRFECDLVVSGYSVKYRLAIIDRWHELEAKAEVKQLTIRESLVLNLEPLDKNEEQARQLEVQILQLESQRPAVEFYERFRDADGLYGVRKTSRVRHPQISGPTPPSGPMASGDVDNFSAAAGLTEAGRFAVLRTVLVARPWLHASLRFAFAADSPPIEQLAPAVHLKKLPRHGS